MVGTWAESGSIAPVTFGYAMARLVILIGLRTLISFFSTRDWRKQTYHTDVVICGRFIYTSLFRKSAENIKRENRKDSLIHGYGMKSIWECPMKFKVDIY
jgi:hypothetical protein